MIWVRIQVGTIVPHWDYPLCLVRKMLFFHIKKPTLTKREVKMAGTCLVLYFSVVLIVIMDLDSVKTPCLTIRLWASHFHLNNRVRLKPNICPRSQISSARQFKSYIELFWTFLVKPNVKFKKGNKQNPLNTISVVYYLRGAVASWWVRSSLGQAVRVWSLVRDIVLCSWAKYFTFIVPSLSRLIIGYWRT